MIELLSFSVAWINLPFTFLLGLSALYWTSMILGVAHQGSSDVDAHAGVDGHVEGDADVDADADGDAHDAGAFAGILKFLHVGEIPFMAVLSVLTLFMWVNTILTNWYLNSSLDPGRAALLMGPNLLVAMVVSRFALTPLVPFFRQLHAGTARPTVFVGRTAVVKTTSISARGGQVEVIIDGDPLLLSARITGAGEIPKGEEVLIVAHDEARGIYEVTKM